MKIVVTQELGLSEEQIARLEKFGEVKLYKDLAQSLEEWLERVRGFNVICSGKFGLKQKYQELNDVLVSVPFVGAGWVDKAVLEQKGITFCNAPGANKDAVCEWVVGMIINLMRELPGYINTTDERFQSHYDRTLFRTRSLYGAKLCIIGAGNIGKKVGRVGESLNMQVSYFRRGDDLLNEIKEADVLVNSLSHNPDTNNMLGEHFFESVKQGSYFISIAPQEVFDSQALFKALDSDVLAGAAIDCASGQAGDSDSPDYQAMRAHPKILATPLMASNTDRTYRLGNDIMIDNIEAWAREKPINLV